MRIGRNTFTFKADLGFCCIIVFGLLSRKTENTRREAIDLYE